MTDETADIVGMTSETIAADLLGALMQEIRLLPDIWPKLGEREQGDIIYRLRQRVKANVGQAVSLIVAQDRVTIKADLQKVVFAKDSQAIFTISPRDPAALDLATARGRTCTIVLADVQQHMEGVDDLKATPDQGSLIADGEQIVNQIQRRSKGTKPKDNPGKPDTSL